MADFQWGWIPPTEEKRAENMLYTVADAMLAAPEGTEQLLGYDVRYKTFYNQGNTPQCVGYSCSWNQTIAAFQFGANFMFDAPWLYRRACDVGKTRDGAYIWAAMDVLRKEGHKVHGEPSPDEEYGIVSYVWGKNSKEARDAIYNFNPVVFGMMWHQSFMHPVMIDEEWWIATQPPKKWGKVLGGHAICGYGYSDKRQAIRLVNSWGAAYPDVWVPYDSIDFILGAGGGECAAATDHFVGPPKPTPSKPKMENARMVYDDKLWTFDIVNVMEKV